MSPLPTIPGDDQPLWKISYFDHNGVQRCIRDLPAKDIPTRVSDLMWDGTAEMWVQVQSGIDVQLTKREGKKA